MKLIVEYSFLAWSGFVSVLWDAMCVTVCMKNKNHGGVRQVSDPLVPVLSLVFLFSMYMYIYIVITLIHVCMYMYM